MNPPTQLSDIPASIREQIVAAAVDALQLTGVTVVRDRLHPIEQDSLPFIGIFSKDVTPMGIGSDYRAPLVERELELHFECRAKATVVVDGVESEIPVSQALDSLLTWVNYGLFHDSRFAGDLPPLGTRLINDIFEKETSPYSREADKPIGSVSRILIIKYRTSRLDPTTKG